MYEKLFLGSAFKDWFLRHSIEYSSINVEESKKLQLKLNAKMKECYKNACLGHVLISGKYCEGFVYDPGLEMWFQHAWCLNVKGEVVDPTYSNTGFKDGMIYRGAPYEKVMRLNVKNKRYDSHMELAFRKFCNKK